jgi:hypothetical protein
LPDADYLRTIPENIDLDLTEIEAGFRAAQPAFSCPSDFLLESSSFLDGPLFAPKGDLLQDMLRSAPPLMPYSFCLDPTSFHVKQEPSSSEGVVPTMPQNLLHAVHAALKRPAGIYIQQETNTAVQAQSATPSPSSSHDVLMVPESSSYAPAKPSSSSSTLSGSSGSIAVLPQASATSGLAAAPTHGGTSYAMPQKSAAAPQGRLISEAVRL